LVFVVIRQEFLFKFNLNMKTKHFSNLSTHVFCLVSWVFCVLWTTGMALATENPVKIGVLAKRGPEQCLEKWSLTAEYLSDRIPDTSFVIVPLDHEKIYPSVERGEIDFILANSSFYVELEHRFRANRIATLKNRCLDRFYTRYYGVIFWKADRSDMRHLNDLRGKTFMATAEESFGGWRMAWRELKEKGLDPNKDFKDLKFGGTQDAVVYAVRDGVVDAGTVRADTFIRMDAEGKINQKNFYVVHEHSHDAIYCPPFPHSTRGYPEWPLAKLNHTPDELAEKVAIALLEMPSDSKAAITAKCGGWTIPMNYQSVHECLKYLKVGPYKDLYKITLKDVVKNYWYIFVISSAVFFIMAGFIFKILRLNRTIKADQIKLEAEIKERYHVENELIEAKKAAESATRTKSAFLANMSHEIRTPMNGVIAAADLALNEDLPPNVRHYLGIIQSSAYSLLEIINDILDFSKIEADKLDLELRPFILDDVLDRVSDIFLNRVAEKSIELLLDVDHNTPKNLIGDPIRLQQIIRNLVDNSIKFSHKGGVVIVGINPTETLPGSVTLSFFVKDSGIGIAQEHIPELFRRFSQVDMSTRRKYAGTGLGLSICKRLVEMMGGKIWVQSELDKGSTFFFTVPFRRPAKEMPRKLVPPPDIQGIKALVVDDCPDSRSIIQKMLKSFGLPVASVSSGKEALRVLEETCAGEDPFKLVIIDWMMPEMDGIEVSKRIRKDLKLTVPIVLMTAFGRGVEKLITKEEGINAFLNKPIAQSTLFNVIMDVFGKEVYGKEKIKHITTRASIYKKHLRGVRILVAEDNLTNQEIAKAILEGAGIIVKVVNNGEEAVEAVKKGHFDAVLMDVQMPKMDGYEATQAIRHDPNVKSIPIIAMTAYAMKGDEEMCLSAGMDAYISKPIRQGRLFATLCKAIKPDEKEPADVKETESLRQDKVAEDLSVTAGDGLPSTLPGINIQNALTELNIDRDLFKQILLGFLQNNRDTISNIRRAFVDKDWDSLMHLSHGLKGSAGNIGADELYAAALTLETASRKGGKYPPDSELIDNIESALNLVLKSLESLIEKPKPQVSKAKHPSPEPERFLSMLSPLADALDIADPEEIKRHFNLLKAHLDRSTVQQLENQINNYDYDKALEKVKEIVKKIE
jgi:signal transduction histidine kinase/DNA-binding response OmpR family regulator/ABC-type phosphate/phosphonate transport system substrate-binding protein/HPt (histidine-containing phosphotransfer) domain-containing protein